MANNIYVVDLLAAPGPTITVNDDGTGIDEIRISGVYPQQVTIRLEYWWSDNPPKYQAAGMYFTDPPPSNAGGTLIVNGVIENARGSNGSDFINGNVLANVIYGDALRTGSGGADIISAGEGNDTVFGGSGNDTIGGGEGNDRLYGDDGVDTINGDAGIDIIEGGAGADILSGGADNGDTVSYAGSNAGVNVRLTYGSATTGVGGHAAGDSIRGFTHVIGSAFNDIIGDTVKMEVGAGGNNNSFSGGDGSDTLTLGGGNDAGYGGAGNDTLNGEAGNDRLDGGTGADLMRGGAGNDLYFVDDLADRVDEAAQGSTGIDTVQSSISVNLTNSPIFQGTIEHATLLGTAGLAIVGNVISNILTGNAGNNVVNGLAGNDVLAGGAGADTFVFSTALNAASNVDRITDFSVAADTIKLENAVFTALTTTGPLTPAAFVKNTAGLAGDADDRIIYETDTGRLFYDANGSAVGGSTHFATLAPNLVLTNADFVVI